MCGQCNNPNDNYFCGDCSQGLECIVKQQEGIDDGMLERRCQRKEGEKTRRSVEDWGRGIESKWQKKAKGVGQKKMGVGDGQKKMSVEDS